MANETFKDASGTTKYRKSTGAGNSGDPAVTHVNVDSLPALAAGTNGIGKLTANSGVDIGDVDVTSVTPGTGATNLGKAIDTATGGTDTGVLVLATRDDALSSLTPAEGDNVQLRVDANGALWVGVNGTVTVGTHAVTQSGTWNITNISGTVSLPTGAATAAKQPALGTAGTASSDVISVQGIASMTPLQVGDNSGSLTVDAPVGTPVFVRLSDGSSAIATLPVSLASVPSHAVTNAGVFAVQVDGNALTALQLIDDPVFADDAAFTPGTSKVMVAGFEADESSTDSVDEGDAGAARMTLDRKQIVTCQPHAAGGLSVFRSLDLDETEEEVKGSAGCLYKLRLTNFSTSPRYVKLYNADAAGTTVGSTTPIDTIAIPGATSASQPTVITENFGGLGLAFSSGLCLAATTALADADTGAPGGNEVLATAYYK